MQDVKNGTSTRKQDYLGHILIYSVPQQKALDLFRPAFDKEERPIQPEEQKTFTSRINLTFRFYRDDFHPLPTVGPYGIREGTPTCKCGLPALLRADQKAKARSRLIPSPTKSHVKTGKVMDRTDGTVASGQARRPETIQAGSLMMEDDMVFFWQCQCPGQTGDMKGCGFFRILDMKAEGRGPCIVDIR